MAVAACAAFGRSGPVGTSAGGSPAGAAAAPGEDGGGDGGGGAPSPIPADFRASMTRVDAARFLSRGHAGGRWDADVYADDAGLEALRSERGAATPGATLIEEHLERADGGAGPIFLMEKRAPGFDPSHGDWRYVAVGARGEVVKDGAIEACRECHGEAPHDHLFQAQ